MNSYRGYRLPDGLKHLYGQLGLSICDTRRDTANLARELGSVDLKPPAKVCPNDLGELRRVAGLAGHAKRESIKVKS